MSVTRLQKFEKKFLCARVQSAVILLDMLCFNFIRAFNFDHMIGGISFLGSVLSVQYTVTLHCHARLAHNPYAGITYPINDDVTPLNNPMFRTNWALDWRAKTNSVH